MKSSEHNNTGTYNFYWSKRNINIDMDNQSEHAQFRNNTIFNSALHRNTQEINAAA